MSRPLWVLAAGSRVGTASKFHGAKLLEAVMKNTRLMVLALFAFLVLLTPAFAQSGGFRVQIPFEFAVGNHTLAAKEYSVTL